MPAQVPQSAGPFESDAARIEAAIAGDEAAWRALVEQYAALVYSVPRRLGLSEAESEDVLQEVFAALVRQLSDLRDVQSLPKWFMTTAHRISWRTIRRSRKRSETGDGLLPAAEADDPPAFDLIDEWERSQLVRCALEQLGGRCRELLHELYMSPNPADYQEIARRLDMPIGSIGPTRGRCMGKLIEILRSMGFPEPDSERK